MHTDFPVGTAIAGKIFHNFRVEIDYPHGMRGLKQSSHPGSNDVDSAGIIFRAAADGTYYVAGIATKNDGFTQCSVSAGDRILQVEPTEGDRCESICLERHKAPIRFPHAAHADALNLPGGERRRRAFLSLGTLGEIGGVKATFH